MQKYKGDVILQCEPFVHVLNYSENQVRCDSCFTRNEDLKKCTGCGMLYYCDRNCQKADWSLHKVECKCLQRCSPNHPLDSVRLFLKLLIRYRKGDTTNKCRNDPGWCTFEDLMSHVEEIKTDCTRQRQFSEILFTIKKLVGPSFTLPEASTLLDIYGKMVINTCSILNEECQPIGAGLYISAAKFDHSCQPNACFTFRGKCLEVRALTQINNPSPENVSISYIDQLAMGEDRIKELEHLYYFTCKCERCRDDKLFYEGLRKLLPEYSDIIHIIGCVLWNAQMLATRCQDDLCAGAVVSQQESILGACDQCGKTPSVYSREDVKECMKRSQTWLQKIDQLRKDKDNKQALDECENFIAKQSRILHPVKHVYMVVCEDRAFQACLEMEQWEEALNHSYNALEGLICYYPQPSPVTGIELMKIGKLEVYLNKLSTAQGHLTQAQSILQVTHGSEYSLVQDLNRLLQQCQMELNLRQLSLPAS